MTSHHYNNKEISMESRKETPALPHELWLEIFSYLNMKELDQAALVCHTWNQLSSDNIIWKKFNTLTSTQPADQFRPTFFKKVIKEEKIRKELKTIKSRYSGGTLEKRRVELLETAIDKIIMGLPCDLNTKLEDSINNKSTDVLPTTYLKLAIAYCTPVVVAFLLSKGAKVTPDVLSNILYYPDNKHYPRILDLLIKNGFDIKKDGRKALVVSEKYFYHFDYLTKALKERGVALGNRESLWVRGSQVKTIIKGVGSLLKEVATGNCFPH